LNDKIYHHGECYTAAELVQLVSGQPLSPAPLMRHLRGKLEPLYGL
jgi:Zn-dependent M32 family carboxypeptidase